MGTMTQSATERVILMRNTPMSAREWQELTNVPGVTSISADTGDLALIRQQGELALYWQFEDLDSMRQHFQPMFEEMRPEISEADVDFVTMDLVQVRDRDWLKPLLDDASFTFFAEWMDMTHPGLDPDAIPEFPEGLTMRRAGDGEVERMFEIWNAAYGELGRAAGTFDAYLNLHSWAGVLEQDEKIVGFAINGSVHAAQGTILEIAVDPEHWGNGYGRMLLAAASYQLTTQDARRATIRVRPDVKQSLRICSDAGFRPGMAGLEYRRPTDEDLIAERLDAKRRAGVKARFGGWR
jgi:ribosomal protein S18 acetylase RimI-like enzyme